jgi:Ca2+-binding RTX toxin-like protein
LQTLDQAGVSSIGLARSGTAQTLGDGSLIHGFSQWTGTAGLAGLAADARLANTGVGFITLNSGPDSQRIIFETGMVFAMDRQGATTNYSLTSGPQTLVSGTLALLADGSVHETADLRLENGQSLSINADYDANGNLRSLQHGLGAITLFSYAKQADGASLARQFTETGLLLEEVSLQASGAGYDRVFDREGTQPWAERLAEFDASGTIIRIRTVSDAGIATVETLKTTTILAADEHHLSYGGTQDAVLTGNAFANTLTGGSGHDQISGGAGNDIVNGGAGDDLLDGGQGSDAMTGGAGNDLYRIDHAGDTVLELAGGGIDTVKSTISLTLMAEVENLDLTGAGALNATGNALDNRITGTLSANILTGLGGHDQLFGAEGNDIVSGGAGDDLLDGGSGLDTLLGGIGNDTYIIDATTLMGYDSEGQTVWYAQVDTVQEAANEGTDTVRITASSYILGGNVENLVGTASTAQDLWGNELNNAITGSMGSDKLNGWSGNDRLDGGAGHDVLTGGVGADTFVFGQAGGKDTILDFNRVAGDKIELKLGTAFDSWAEIIAAASQSGYDTVISVDAQTCLTLKNISKASLVASDFVFV